MLNAKKNINKLKDESSNLKDVLTKLMDQKKINVPDLALAINLPHPTIYRLVNGIVTDPKISTLLLIASYFSISIEQLLGLEPIEEAESLKYRLATSVFHPILSWKDAIKGKNFILNLNRENWSDWFQTEKMPSSKVYCLRSKKSMEPRFQIGSILVIDPESDILDGDLVIVRYEDTDEATIREIVLDGPEKKLLQINQDLNKDAKLDVFDNTKTLLGVVIKTSLNFKN